MIRIAVALLFVALAGLVGCTTKPLPAELIAKLKGGTTKVVVYGFCVPMDHLIKTAITRYTMTFVVNGKSIGTMKSCSYATFSVPSGYWKSKFVPSGLRFPHSLPSMIFRPGKTQYLYMRPAGYGNFSGHWISKAEAEKGIAAIKNIKQLF